LARIQGGPTKRGRNHETLVNTFALWLENQGFEVGRSPVIDLGLESPPVIIEAKWVISWPKAVREAVGQLYEYRYFQVASPESRLVFLAQRPVPEIWIKFLEEDREIGAVWREGKGFKLSRLAKSGLKI
jgi:hypothetical protein